MQWTLVRLRKEKGLTQEELANKMDLHVTSYRNKEWGKSEFKANELFFLANFFNKRIEDIFLPTDCINNAVKGKKEDFRCNN